MAVQASVDCEPPEEYASDCLSGWKKSKFPNKQQWILDCARCAQQQPADPQTEPIGDECDDVTGPYYTVQAGDTLSKIARCWGTTVAEIAECNDIENVDLIFPGQVFVQDDAPPPTSSNVKPEIVAWLRCNGVALDDDALAELTKAELLDLVGDLTN